MMLTRQTLKTALSAVLLTSLGLTAAAQKQSPVQSKADPFKLDIVAPVMVAGSDDDAATFQEIALPSITKFLSAELSEGKWMGDLSGLLDPSKLTLKTAADVRIYFIGEGASFENSLGFNTLDGFSFEVDSGRKPGKGGNGKSDLPEAIGPNGLLIFPNVSSPVSSYDPAANVTRTKSAPLLPGDFVNLGKLEGGTRLDFFLIADGANGGTTTYSTDSSLNPDGINHVVSFAYAMKDSPYLLLGFEDLYGGGDRDFNDVLFALDLGAANLAALTATPEPATIVILGSFIGLGWALKARNKRSMEKAILG